MRATRNPSATLTITARDTIGGFIGDSAPETFTVKDPRASASGSIADAPAELSKVARAHGRRGERSEAIQSCVAVERLEKRGASRGSGSPRRCAPRDDGVSAVSSNFAPAHILLPHPC